MATTNLVTNGDFAAGTLTNWTTTNVTVVPSGLPIAPVYAAQLTAAPGGGTATIVETTNFQRAGEKIYSLSFVGTSNVAGSLVTFLINGVPYGSPVTVNTGFYQLKSMAVTVNGNFTVGFRLNNDTGVDVREVKMTSIQLLFNNPVPTTILENAGFDDGDIKPWSETGTVVIRDNKPATPSQAGPFLAEMDSTLGPSSILQTVLTTEGVLYTISMWINVVTGPASITMTVNGVPVSGATALPVTSIGSYQQHVFFFTADHWYTNVYFQLDTGNIFVDTFDFASAFTFQYIQNPSFETGSLTPGWTGTSMVVNTLNPHQGIYAAHLQDIGSSLSQAITMANGNTYQLSFWYNLTTADKIWLRVMIGGVPIPTSPIGIDPGMGYQNLSTTYLASGPAVLELEPIPPFPLDPFDLAVDDFSMVLVSIACYRGDVKFSVIDTRTGESLVLPVSEIRSDRHLVYEANQEKYVPITHIVVFPPISKLVKLTSSDGEEVHLTPGHKVIFNGKEVKAIEVPGRERVVCEPSPVYSIILKERGIVIGNGLSMVADGEEEWARYKAIRSASYQLH